MTNHWVDIGNSDCILSIGSNPAENHPASFGWIQKAKDRGAKLISVDPRFTRTSSKADIYARMRSGTDIAFIGGMIKWVLEDMEENPAAYNMTYVREYTNAAFLIDPNFKGADELDGLFSGYEGAHNETDPAKRKYDKSTWMYQLDSSGIPKVDKTLQDTNCVFQILKRQFARYDVDTVCSITGTDKETFLEVCRTYSATGRPGKAGTIMYAMGTTQHTYGTQNIRSYAILQFLLGNIGVSGGGINALRGESNVQGSTDMCLLAHILPGYLKQPINKDTSLKAHNDRALAGWANSDPLSLNWWKNYPKYIVSLLKAFYGNSANKGNDFGFNWLPKTTKPTTDYSHIALFEAMYAGQVKGLMAWGQNPAVGGPNSNLKAIDPPGDAKPDLWIINRIMSRVKELYAAEGGALSEAIAGVAWDYGHEPDPREVAKEVNGYDLTTGKLMATFGALKDDGTTSSGNWLYCNSVVEPELEPDAPIPGNRASRRDPTPDAFGTGLYPKWAWCWPVNRRIIYNRASVDLDGVPWDKEHPVIWWQGDKWVGDVPDGGAPPMNEGGYYPFIMQSEGHGRIFGRGRADGPLPEHYEPWESPVENLMSIQQNDPAFKIWPDVSGRPEEKGDPSRYPIVATTYRLVEHWQAGQLTRNLPWLVEQQPEMFVEISEELAVEKGISNGGKVIVESARGEVKGIAMVTKRFKPFRINGRIVHQIGMPWHWGYMGLSTGDSANLLTPHVGDANTMIPEYKAFLCNVRRV